MIVEDRFPHYLRELLTSRQPRYHVALDTEAASARDGGAFVQTWACAAAVYWRSDRGYLGEPEQLSTYTTPDRLWDHIAAWAPKGKRTVVWAHNLGYDLRISGALRELPARGYQLQGIVLERTAAWASFRGPEGTILCCDLASWVPGPLRRLADEMGRPKLAGRPEREQLGELLERCKRDAEITAAAADRILHWLDSENLGPFRPTGAGQSHAAYRRRFLTCPPLVHADVGALEAERLAMHTGRAEAWQHGRHQAGPYTEYDLRLAYAHIARDCQLPMALTGHGTGGSWERLERLSRRFAVLAEVTVTLDSPAVPAPLSERTVWPVGTFKTVLWDPELQLLREHGARVEVGRHWLYRRGPVLAVFASWILERLHPEHGEQDPVIRRVLKHWSRTCVGRMALRYRRWDEWGDSPQDGLGVGVMLDLESGRASELLQVGRVLFELAEMAEADSSVPQVTGWVMSEARARLWRLMHAVGECGLLYVDTDSLIVNGRGAALLDWLIDRGEAWTLERKGSYRALEIRGPRNLELEAERRISGVPRKARRSGPVEFQGEVWRSLRESIERGELVSVVTIPRVFRPDAPDPRRLHTDRGKTEAIRMQLPESPGD